MKCIYVWAIGIIALLLSQGCEPVAHKSDIDRLDKELSQIRLELIKTRDELTIYKKLAISKKKYIEVTATGYTAREEECDETPWVTASGKPSTPGWTVAVSRDLMDKGWYCQKVYIPGLGRRGTFDLMNARFTKRVDILFPTVEEAEAWGVRKVKLFIVN